jgi:hypothetical protein
VDNSVTGGQIRDRSHIADVLGLHETVAGRKLTCRYTLLYLCLFV